MVLYGEYLFLFFSVFRCIAENELGKVQSRDVHVRAGTAEKRYFINRGYIIEGGGSPIKKHQKVYWKCPFEEHRIHWIFLVSTLDIHIAPNMNLKEKINMSRLLFSHVDWDKKETRSLCYVVDQLIISRSNKNTNCNHKCDESPTTLRIQ